MISVSGPDKGGNYSLGTTVEGVMGAVESVRQQGGLVIAERNTRMPFVLGTTIPEKEIDYLLDSDYTLPASPVKPPDEASERIGRIIAQRYVTNGATLQYGIGQVPEAVTAAILEKGVRNLGIHTELFAPPKYPAPAKRVLQGKDTGKRVIGNTEIHTHTNIGKPDEVPDIPKPLVVSVSPAQLETH